jgi:phage gpG-like protein
MIRFNFEIDGVKQFDRAFNRVEGHVKDLRPVWDYAEAALIRIEEEQFLSEGAKGAHGKWAPLSKPYYEYKELRWPGRPILQRNYDLVSSLTDTTADSIRVKEKQEFAFGTKVVSKEPHNKGFNYPLEHQRGNRRMPARRPIDLSESQRRDLTKAIQKGLLEIIRADKEIQFDKDVASGFFDDLKR